MKVMVETSARHVHVSEADLKTLFGADAKLTVKKELSRGQRLGAARPVRFQREGRGHRPEGFPCYVHPWPDAPGDAG